MGADRVVTVEAAAGPAAPVTVEAAAGPVAPVTVEAAAAPVTVEAAVETDARGVANRARLRVIQETQKLVVAGE